MVSAREIAWVASRLARWVARACGLCLWSAICVVRLTLGMVLAILEPLVSLVLSGLVVLGLLTAVLFEASAISATFPFWGMIAFSVGCAALLVAYYVIMNFLGR